MRLIAKPRLIEFWSNYQGDQKLAENRLIGWYKAATKSQWNNFAELKQTFPSADQVGYCIVFDVGNNLFRVIGRVNYNHGKVYLLKIMDHKEYDKQSWVKDCNCHKPPPNRNRGKKDRGRHNPN